MLGSRLCFASTRWRSHEETCTPRTHSALINVALLLGREERLIGHGRAQSSRTFRELVQLEASDRLLLRCHFLGSRCLILVSVGKLGCRGPPWACPLGMRGSSCGILLLDTVGGKVLVARQGRKLLLPMLLLSHRLQLVLLWTSGRLGKDLSLLHHVVIVSLLERRLFHFNAFLSITRLFSVGILEVNTEDASGSA